MRFTGMCACAIVAWDCAEKAAALQPQKLFAPDQIWIWWIIAGLWTFSAIKFIAAD